MNPDASVTMGYLKNVVGGLESKIDNLDSKITTNVTSTMNEEMRKMFMDFMGKPSKDNVPPSPSSPRVSETNKDGNAIPDVDAEAKAKAEADAKAKKEESGTSTPRNGSGTYGQVPPEQVYNNIHPIIPTPHIANMGSPPKLEPSQFATWQFQMQSHISSSCTHLWNCLLYTSDAADEE